MDSIRQWQRHYRKAFPQFVFYFDSIPEDMRRKCSRQVMALGAVSILISLPALTKIMTHAYLVLNTDCSNLSRTTLLTNSILVRGEILFTFCDPRCHFAYDPARIYRPYSRGICPRD
jgi:hypothetical protein